MRVSALYGDRLSTASQDHIVETAEKNQKILEQMTRKMEDSYKKADLPQKTEQAVLPETKEDNTAADQMMGIGNGFDAVVDN